MNISVDVAMWHTSNERCPRLKVDGWIRYTYEMQNISKFDMHLCISKFQREFVQ